jgi:TRAP-type C4-dicarboxylate transport system substrate-binding protein
MASADPVGIEHDPAVAFFVDRVAQLSGGRLRIALDERWARGATAHEPALLRDVARGRADLGWAYASSFDRVGVNSFQVLQAPLLIDRPSVQDAVIRGPLAAQLLAGVRTAGLQGLALLAGPMSRLVGVNQPVRDVDDLRGLVFAGPDSSLADYAVHAVHGYPRRITPATVALLYVDTDGRPARPAALDEDLDSLFFDRYGGACGSSTRGCVNVGPWMTTNAILWPRAAVLVANPRRLRGLDAQERTWVAEAAAQAARYSTTRADDDARLLRELCAAGVRFTTASPAALVRLRRAWRPVYRRLRARPDARAALRTIMRLRAQAPAAAPLRPPAVCGTRPRPSDAAAHGVPSTLPDGVYRVQLTDADLRAAGANQAGDRPGTATLTLRGGHWRLVLTEPGRDVRSGTYAGAALRTAWATAGHGRDETYFSIVVGRDRALRFRVAWAQNLASTQATYASHAWRRIGG